MTFVVVLALIINRGQSYTRIRFKKRRMSRKGQHNETALLRTACLANLLLRLLDHLTKLFDYHFDEFRRLL